MVSRNGENNLNQALSFLGASLGGRDGDNAFFSLKRQNGTKNKPHFKLLRGSNKSYTLRIYLFKLLKRRFDLQTLVLIRKYILND